MIRKGLPNAPEESVFIACIVGDRPTYVTFSIYCCTYTIISVGGGGGGMVFIHGRFDLPLETSIQGLIGTTIYLDGRIPIMNFENIHSLN